MFAPQQRLFASLLAGAAIVLIVAALAAVARSDSRGDDAGPRVGALRTLADPLSGFSRPRTVHFAPDGRLLITDVGTGNDDGRVVAVDLERKTQEVLMDRLPSTRDSGQPFAPFSGPSGAAMAPDGTLCVVIGDGPADRGFAEMRCTDGLRVDLKAYELANNPEGMELESNPFDIVPGTDSDWYVSDAAANVVLNVRRDGTVRTVGIFDSVAGPGTPEGVPTGMAAWNGRLTTALYGGAVLTGGLNLTVPVFVEDAHPIAAAPPYSPISPTGGGQFVVYLTHSDLGGGEGTGTIRLASSVIVDGLDRPTGFVRLADGRLVVAEEERGRVRIVEELK